MHTHKVGVRARGGLQNRGWSERAREGSQNRGWFARPAGKKGNTLCRVCAPPRALPLFFFRRVRKEILSAGSVRRLVRCPCFIHNQKELLGDPEREGERERKRERKGGRVGQRERGRERLWERGRERERRAEVSLSRARARALSLFLSLSPPTPSFPPLSLSISLLSLIDEFAAARSGPWVQTLMVEGSWSERDGAVRLPI